MLNQAHKRPLVAEEGTFLIDDDFSNAEKAVEYAAAHGIATVVDEQGNTVWTISMLTEDLPELQL